MQHLALNVDTKDDIIAMRDRIRSRGVNVVGPIDHGFCYSIYFAGPEHLSLEISTSAGVPIDPRAWIDPEVVELAGISAEELERYKNPEPYSGEGGDVAQPPIDASKPHLRYPEDVYKRMIERPDAMTTEQSSYTEPPVKVD